MAEKFELFHFFMYFFCAGLIFMLDRRRDMQTSELESGMKAGILAILPSTMLALFAF